MFVSSIKANCTFFPWTNAAPSSEQACPVGVYLHSPLQRDTKGLIWAPPAGSACKRVSPKWLLLKTRRKEQRALPRTEGGAGGEGELFFPKCHLTSNTSAFVPQPSVWNTITGAEIARLPCSFPQRRAGALPCPFVCGCERNGAVRKPDGTLRRWACFIPAIRKLSKTRVLLLHLTIITPGAFSSFK